MAEGSPPTVAVIGGPNGAGKTTASRGVLADTLRLLTFVNADVIAQGLAGFAPESAAFEAGRIMQARLEELANARASFAIESTLSGKTLAGWLGALRDTGYQIMLFYCWLHSADLSVARVAQRVSMGGHDIPEPTIRRRYRRSVGNFFALYRPIATKWWVYDNSASHRLIAEGTGSVTTVWDDGIWKAVQAGGLP